MLGGRKNSNRSQRRLAWTTFASRLQSKTPTDKRRASVNITLWRFEASHTMRVRSAGPFCVKMFNSLQASKDQLFV